MAWYCHDMLPFLMVLSQQKATYDIKISLHSNILEQTLNISSRVTSYLMCNSHLKCIISSRSNGGSSVMSLQIYKVCRGRRLDGNFDTVNNSIWPWPFPQLSSPWTNLDCFNPNDDQTLNKLLPDLNHVSDQRPMKSSCQHRRQIWSSLWFSFVSW